MGVIYHVKTSAVGDSTDTNLVRPSDWNSSHLYTLVDGVSVSAGNTAGTLAIISSGTAYFAGGNNITLSQNANSITISGANAGGSLNISAGTTSNNLSAVTFSNSNNVSFGLSGSTITASYAYNVSAGTTSNNLSAITFSNSNNVSFGLNSSTLTANAPINFSAGTTSNNLTNLVFSNSNNISFGLNGSTITAQYDALSEYEPVIWDNGMVTNSSLGQNTLYFMPFDVKHPLSAYRMNAYVSISTSVSAGNSTGQCGYTLSAALYTRGTGTNTDRISSFWSISAPLVLTMNSNTQLVITNLAGISNSTAVSTVGTTISNANATTYPQSSMGGFRVIPLPISQTLTAGRYWLAIANSSSATPTSSGTVCQLAATYMMQTISNNVAFVPFGTVSSASNNGFYVSPPGIGTYTTTSNAFPGSVALTTNAISCSGTATWPYINFSAYTTGTNVL